MAAGRHLPGLLMLLLVYLVMSAVFSTAYRSSEEKYSVCNTRCCKVEPNCSAALHVACRCHFAKRVVLRDGDFPPSVETIYFYGVRNLTITANALLNLPSLTRVELRQIEWMKVLSNGLALNTNSSLAFLAIDSVRHMELKADAFSGHWDTEAKLRIGYVSSLVLSQNTFSFQSSPHIPSLVIEHATLPDIEPMAFNASLEFLTLKDVEIKMCRRNGFGGSIQALSMDRVDLNELRAGCINGSGSLRRLSVSNSRLGVIRHRGIYGSIPTVTIRNCSVSLLQPNGLQLRTTELNIYSSKFTSIMTRGLNVLANQIYLRKMVVDTLHGHALKALRTTENEDDSPSIHIFNLTVKHTYNGSLAFDPETNVEVVHLSVGIPEPPVCPVERWIRQLTDASEKAPLGPTQKQMQAQLHRHWLCKESSSTTPAAAGAKDGGGESVEEEDPHLTTTDDADAGNNDSDPAAEVIALLIVVALVMGVPIVLCAKVFGKSGRYREKGIVKETSSGSPSSMESQRSKTVTDSVVRRRKKPNTSNDNGKK